MELLGELHNVVDWIANRDVAINMKILNLLESESNQPFCAGVAAGLARGMADLRKIRSMLSEIRASAVRATKEDGEE